MLPIALRKANPTPGDVHVDRPLTNISVAWLQDATRYIADRVFPIVPVAKQGDKYFVFDRADWLRAVAEVRGPSTESAGGGFRVSTDTYFADVYAYHKDVDDQVRGNQDAPLNMDRSATQFSTQACVTRRELDWATDFFATGVWTTERAGVASGPTGTQFLRWDVANSTPIVDLRGGIQAISRMTGYRPNILVLGSDVWNTVQDHADFVDRVKAGQTPGGPAIVNLNALAAVLEIPRVVVAEAVMNTGPEGGTESTDFILGKHALLAYANPAPAIDQPSAGYIFAWTGLLGAGAAGNRIKRFRIEKEASDRVECEMAYAQKKVSADLGAFFLDAVS